MINRETAEAYVLASIGLIKGIGNVILKPLAMEEKERVGKVATAAIHYFRSKEGET